MADPQLPQQRALLDRLQPTIRRAAKAIGARFHVEADDLLGIGHLAAVEVTRTFDPGRNDDVSVFGYARIAGEMLDTIAKENATDVLRLVAVMQRFASRESATIDPIDAHAEEDVVREQLDAALASVASAAVLGLSQPETAADDALDQQRLHAALESGLARLDQDQRMLIDLVFFKGLSMHDASAAVGLKERTARRRKHEALEALREMVVAEHDALG